MCLSALCQARTALAVIVVVRVTAFQLVSRAGVVPEPELIEFRSAVENLAATLGARVSAPGMREALQAARELDGACAEADIQVALHVVGF